MWQIAAGREGINYVDVFKDYDVMLIGNGDRGCYKEHPDRYPKCRDFRNQVRRFAVKPSPGDVVVMRFGDHAKGVGTIPTEDPDYHWSQKFSDVLGWDLQHMRRVLWDEKALTEIEDLNPAFESTRQDRTFSGVGSGRGELKEREAEIRQSIESRELKELPELTEELDDEALGVELFDEGLPNRSVDRVLKVIQRARRLRSWYSGDMSGESRPTEHEVVAHVVVPLLIGLGWSEQLMAVEWKNIDVALFGDTPTTPDSCLAVIEVKRKAAGFGDARNQAIGYIEKQGLQRCRNVFVTDGAKLYQFERDDEGWPTEPTGYVNLKKIRRSNVVFRGLDAVETLLGLTPRYLLH